LFFVGYESSTTTTTTPLFPSTMIGDTGKDFFFHHLRFLASLFPYIARSRCRSFVLAPWQGPRPLPFRSFISHLFLPDLPQLGNYFTPLRLMFHFALCFLVPSIASCFPLTTILSVPTFVPVARCFFFFPQHLPWQSRIFPLPINLFALDPLYTLLLPPSSTSCPHYVPQSEWFFDSCFREPSPTTSRLLLPC